MLFSLVYNQKKVYEALGDPDWLLAMQEQLSNFERNKVWSLVHDWFSFL
jgi:hypothetical protein